MQNYIKKNHSKKIIISLVILCIGITAQAQCILFSEDFANSIGSQITTTDNGGSASWSFTNSCSASNLPGHSGPGSVVFQGLSTSSTAVPCQFGNAANTVKGNLNIPGLGVPSTGTCTLTFNYYLVNQCTATCDKDKLSLMISSDGGATFSTIMDSYLVGGLPPTPGGWTAKTYNLSTSYAGQTVIIRFNFNSVDGTANSFDGVYLDDLQVTATDGPAKPGVIAGTSVVCQNTSASYTIAPVNSATTYSWTVPAGASITSGQGTTSVTVSYGSSSGNLSVVATNTCGVSAARTLSVSVSSPMVTASSAVPFICQGDSTQLTASSNVPAAGTFTLGTGTITNTSYTYPAPYGNEFWGARHQMLIKAAELTALGMVAGQINSLAFDVTALNGTPVHDGFTIQMGATSLTSLTSFQSGLTTVYGPVNYQPVLGWNTHTFSVPFMWDGVSNVIVETCFNNSSWISNASVNQSTTSYTSTVYHNQDASGICGSTAVSGTKMQRPNMKFDAAAMMVYSWSPSYGLSSTTVSNPKAAPSVTTTYTVTGTTSCGSVSSVITVTVNPAVASVNAGNDITICQGWTAMLNGSSVGGSDYLWSTGQTAASITISPTSSSTYTLVVANSSGCTKSDEINVIVNPSGSANAGADMKICSGQTVLLNGSGNGTFNWSPPTGLSCTACANAGANPTVTTTYTLTVSNNCGSVTDEVTVTVDAAVASAGSDVTICPAGSIILNGSGNGTYSWSPALGLDCTTCPNPTATPVSSTTYTLTVTNKCGTGNDEVLVTVDPSGVATASAGSDVTICASDSTVLSGSGNGSYQWSPPTGLNCTTCANPVAAPGSTITYTLTVAGSCGTAEDSVTVMVDPCLTGVAMQENDDGLMIVPNPGSGLFMLMPGKAISGEAKIEVVNMQGEIIYSIKNDMDKSESMSLDISNVSPGMYFLRWQTDNDAVMRKIMINH